MSALLVELLCCMKNDIKRIINLIICNHLNFNFFSSLILSPWDEMAHGVKSQFHRHKGGP